MRVILSAYALLQSNKSGEKPIIFLKTLILIEFWSFATRNVDLKAVSLCTQLIEVMMAVGKA